MFFVRALLDLSVHINLRLCGMMLTGNYTLIYLSGDFMRYVKCLFCENRRKRGHSLCSFCFSLYGPYQSESWYHELISMEKQQRRITKIESTNYNVDYFPKETETYWGSFRKRGRPRTTEVVESYIRSIYQEQFSVRQLTSICNNAGLNVSRESVRGIINKIKLTKK
jgi:hypothetical protein